MKSIEFSIAYFVIFYLVPIQSFLARPKVDFNVLKDNKALVRTDEDDKKTNRNDFKRFTDLRLKKNSNLDGKFGNRSKLQKLDKKPKLSTLTKEAANEENEESDMEFYKPVMTYNRRTFKGSRTSVKEFPFIVSVHFSNRSQCGGSIIKSDLVITAASCLQLVWTRGYIRNNPGILSVRFGSDHSDFGGEKIDFHEINFHPLYNPKTLKNNLAIIRLVRKMKSNVNKIKKIDIDKSRFPLDPDMPGITVLGWGVQSINKIPTSSNGINLYYDKLNIYSWRECQDAYSSEYVTQTNFCAGTTLEEGGVCNHDVGGPGISDRLLVGVVSFGASICGNPDSPTVFTKLGFYTDWIEEIMEQPIVVSTLRTTHKSWTKKLNVQRQTTFTRTTFTKSVISPHSEKILVETRIKPMDMNKLTNNFMDSMFYGDDVNYYSDYYSYLDYMEDDDYYAIAPVPLQDRPDKKAMQLRNYGYLPPRQHRRPRPAPLSDYYDIMRFFLEDVSPRTRYIDFSRGSSPSPGFAPNKFDIKRSKKIASRYPNMPIYSELSKDVAKEEVPKACLPYIKNTLLKKLEYGFKNNEHKLLPTSQNTQFEIDKVKKAIIDISSLLPNQNEQQERKPTIDVDTEQSSQNAIDKLKNSIIDISVHIPKHVEQEEREPTIDEDSQKQPIRKSQNNQYAVDKLKQAITDISPHIFNQAEQEKSEQVTDVDTEHKSFRKSRNSQNTIDVIKKAIIDISSHLPNQIEQEESKPIIDEDNKNKLLYESSNIQNTIDVVKKAINEISLRVSSQTEQDKRDPMIVEDSEKKSITESQYAIEKLKKVIIDISSQIPKQNELDERGPMIDEDNEHKSLRESQDSLNKIDVVKKAITDITNHIKKEESKPMIDIDTEQKSLPIISEYTPNTIDVVKKAIIDISSNISKQTEQHGREPITDENSENNPITESQYAIDKLKKVIIDISSQIPKQNELEERGPMIDEDDEHKSLRKSQNSLNKIDVVKKAIIDITNHIKEEEEGKHMIDIGTEQKPLPISEYTPNTIDVVKKAIIDTSLHLPNRIEQDETEPIINENSEKKPITESQYAIDKLKKAIIDISSHTPEQNEVDEKGRIIIEDSEKKPITESQYATEREKLKKPIIDISSHLPEQNELDERKPMIDENNLSEHNSLHESQNTQNTIDVVRKAITDISNHIEQEERKPMIDRDNKYTSLHESQNTQNTIDVVKKAIMGISSHLSNQIEQEEKKPTIDEHKDNEPKLLNESQNRINVIKKAIIDIYSHLLSNKIEEEEKRPMIDEHSELKSLHKSENTQYAIDEVKKAIFDISNQIKQEESKPTIDINTEPKSLPISPCTPKTIDVVKKAIIDISNHINQEESTPMIDIDTEQKNILWHKSNNFESTTMIYGPSSDDSDIIKYVSGENVLDDTNPQITDFETSVSPGFAAGEIDVKLSKEIASHSPQVIVSSDGVKDVNNEVPGLALTYTDKNALLRKQKSSSEDNEYKSLTMSQNTQYAIDKLKKAIIVISLHVSNQKEQDSIKPMIDIETEHKSPALTLNTEYANDKFKKAIFDILTYKSNNFEATEKTSDPLPDDSDIIKYVSGDNFLEGINRRSVHLSRESSFSPGFASGEIDLKGSKEIAFKDVNNEVPGSGLTYTDENALRRKQESNVENTEHKALPLSQNNQYAIDKLKNAIIDISQKFYEIVPETRKPMIDVDTEHKELPTFQNTQYAYDIVKEAIMDILSQKSNKKIREKRKPMIVVDTEHNNINLLPVVREKLSWNFLDHLKPT